MEPIIGRIEQLTFFTTPQPYKPKKPDDSGEKRHDFFKRQDELNQNLLKGLVTLEETFAANGKNINHNFRAMSAMLAAIQAILIDKGLTTSEELNELTTSAIKILDEQGFKDD